MKFKQLAPLCASLLLLAACSTSGGASSSVAPAPATSSVEPATSSQAKTYMTTIDPGKFYIDINFTNKPENFGIKFGNQVISETTTIDLPAADTQFQVTGALNNVCFYRAYENDGAVNAGISENVDEEAANDILARLLNRITKLSRESRNYICITDTVGGYSKTVPGVETIIQKFINNPFGA